MAVTSPSPTSLEPAVRAAGEAIAAKLPRQPRNPAAAAERRLNDLMLEDPALKAALFRFVDVRPACTSHDDLVRHLHELLDEAGASPTARRAAGLVGHTPRRAVALAAGTGVKHMAKRFIIGEDAASAVEVVEGLWKEGAATTVDLLGEATVTEAEADTYFRRCEDVLRTLSASAQRWPARPALEAGGLPRVNLSVKVSALTPELRPLAPERGIAGARPRLRSLMLLAQELGAHLHVDMESFDTREAITALVLELLETPELQDLSAGLVLQGYLEEAPEHLDELLRWSAAHPREHPLTIRLVKGAYWDHEVVEAAQHGWTPPVVQGRAACDALYERLTRQLLDAAKAGLVRPAIASHNLRSLAHAMAYADAIGLPPEALELQVLRGLGDDTQVALAALGRRVRTYCPVGDLVAGMAYLVRRLLENTANDSFLAAAAGGLDLDTLLAPPTPEPAR